LTIDTGFDMAVQTSPTWTGLAFTNAADRDKREISYAANFGNALDAEAIAVVGIDQVRGRPSIVGALVDRRSSTEIRRAIIALDPEPSIEQMKALAEFLAGENLEPEGIEILTRRKDPSGPIATASSTIEGTTDRGTVEVHRRWNSARRARAGAYLLSIDGNCRDEIGPGMGCFNEYRTSTPGYLAIGGGVVAATATLYLFVRKDSRARSAYAVPTPGGAMAGFVARF
jgi:hypothetical protein